MENTNSPSPPLPPSSIEEDKTQSEPSIEPAKKKKKTKVAIFDILYVILQFFFVIGKTGTWFSNEEERSLATGRKVEKCTATL